MALLNRFARFYNARILHRSSMNCRLGDLYDWAGIFNNRLVPVDENIVNFLGASAAARQQLRTQLESAPTYKANFADVVDLTSEVKVGAKIDLPNVPAEIAADLSTKTILSFRFEQVRTRPMPDELGIELRELLEAYKLNNFPAFEQRLRPYDLVVALYYAEQVVIKIDSSSSLSAEASAKVASLGDVKVSADGHQELRFDQSDCPFAATLKAAKEY